MNAIAKMLLGFILLVGGIYWYLAPELLGPNLDALVMLVRGSFGGFLAFVGLVFVIVGKEERSFDVNGISENEARDAPQEAKEEKDSITDQKKK